MLNIFFKTTLISIIVGIVGCASIMHGTTQDVGISSNPSSAKVWANGQELGKTPLNTKLTRKDNHIIKIELDGYEPYETTFTRSVSGWVWGNIVIGGLIGLAIDGISGGLYKLTPEQITAELREKKSVGQEGARGDNIHIFVALKPKEGWVKVGQLKAIN